MMAGLSPLKQFVIRNLHSIFCKLYLLSSNQLVSCPTSYFVWCTISLIFWCEPHHTPCCFLWYLCPSSVSSTIRIHGFLVCLSVPPVLLGTLFLFDSLLLIPTCVQTMRGIIQYGFHFHSFFGGGVYSSIWSIWTCIRVSQSEDLCTLCSVASEF